MDYSAEEKALIWLCACGGFDYRERVALLRAAKNPARLAESWEKISRSVIKSGKVGLYNSERIRGEAEALCDRLAQKEYFAVTVLDDDYPVSLKAIPDPPLVLFGAGRRELLRERKFSVVGSRITPPWAAKQAYVLAKTLSERFAVVTGFAEGGDRAAIDGALESGNLICVLPTGLDECYPARHADLKERVKAKGLLLSEYPPEEKLKKFYFHARNRILAGLSEGVLVVSAGERSGALITANCALEYGREVFAFPYNIGLSQGIGCNELIKKGAALATCADDIFFLFGMEEAKKETIKLDPSELAVFEFLKQSGETHVAVIAEKLGKPICEISATLSSLELKNLVASAGGNRYAAL